MLTKFINVVPFLSDKMIITRMDYLEQVYRGKLRGTNFEYVYVIAEEVKPNERKELERIAKDWTYILGMLGHHKHSEDDRDWRYRGISNKVRFVQQNGETRIYIRGPYAYEIAQEIEKLHFAQFVPDKETAIFYDLESKVKDKNVIF